MKLFEDGGYINDLKRGKTRVIKLRLVLVLHLHDWLRGWCEFYVAITECRKQNQCNTVLIDGSLTGQR